MTPNPSPSASSWLVMDERYHSDPDGATCLFIAETMKEAEEYVKDYPGSVIVKE